MSQFDNIPATTDCSWTMNAAHLDSDCCSCKVLSSRSRLQIMAAIKVLDQARFICAI